MKKDRRNRLRQYGRLDERLAVLREQERLKLPSANLVPERVVAEREVQRLREGLGL